MEENTVQIRQHINKTLYIALQGTIFKEKLTDHNVSLTRILEKQIFEYIAASSLFSNDELEKLKKGLNLK